jgi:hypothetical protein
MSRSFFLGGGWLGARKPASSHHFIDLKKPKQQSARHDDI